MRDYYKIFEKGGVRHCKFCLSREGTVARVFGSEQEFKDSAFSAGYDDVAGDDQAATAVWPGKNNVGFSEDEWTLCTPVHPSCGHSWREFYGADHEFDDWFGSMGVDALIAKHTKE